MRATKGGVKQKVQMSSTELSAGWALEAALGQASVHQTRTTWKRLELNWGEAQLASEVHTRLPSPRAPQAGCALGPPESLLQMLILGALLMGSHWSPGLRLHF